MPDENNHADVNEAKPRKLTSICSTENQDSKTKTSTRLNMTNTSTENDKSNLARSFSLGTEESTRRPSAAGCGETQYRLAFLKDVSVEHSQPLKYDFQNFGAPPLVIMPTTTMPPAAEANQSQCYYTVNDANTWSNGLTDAVTFNTPTFTPSNYYAGNNQPDYCYPIVYGVRNAPNLVTADSNYFPDVYVNGSNLTVGYASPYVSQPYTTPFTSYTTLQPQNFYASMQPQYSCKRDCIPTTRVPTTRCTKKPGSPVPIIAWENNNTCCCELYGSSCGKRTAMGGRSMYGPCKPPPTAVSNYRNSNSLYCNGRRRKREYYLQAPKARQRLQRESDRCRITTTTTPKPKPWPTNYPIKFRLQKSMDMATALTENQVNNLRRSPRNLADKICINDGRENNHMNTACEKTNRSRGHVRVTKNVPETASSKLRKKHNEIKMQELQETLEIALEKMNQEMNE